jgi:superfamily II DNA or RNA helicase
MSFKPTQEQENILSAAQRSDDNLMIVAMAGTGKTSTLKLVSQVLPCRPSLALAFNVKIKKELESAFPSHFTVKTMNGLGHAAWGKAIGKRCASCGWRRSSAGRPRPSSA